MPESEPSIKMSGRKRSWRINAPSATERTRESARLSCPTIQQQRNKIQIIENGVDLTPAPLSHRSYWPIAENELTAFDAIIHQTGSATRSFSQMYGSTVVGTGSYAIPRSLSVQTNVLPGEEMLESLLSTGNEFVGVHDSSSNVDDDEAPSQFCLPRSESSLMHADAKKVTIVLKETETFFLFEMPQLTADLDTPEGLEVQRANEQYESVVSSTNRKLIDAESQTLRVHVKNQSTFIGHAKRQNRGTMVNNWDMHDTYAATRRSSRSDDPDAGDYRIIRSLEHESINRANERPKNLAEIYEKPEFQDAVQVMERIINNNDYKEAQKRFKALIIKDPCSLDLDITYSLDLLWTHTCELTTKRSVSCLRWNPSNDSLLAVGYTSQSESSTDGILLIWCMKNPTRPDRIYHFPSAISDANWSENRPNLLAIGLFDGTINVIDVSHRDLTIIRKSRRDSTSSYSPHWQVQWWGEENERGWEAIYTSNQDGRVRRYRTGEDFTSSEIMRIPKNEGNLTGGGIKKKNNCSTLYDIPINRNPGAILLRRHPETRNIYLVGTDEGCVNRCSTNYLHQRIDSFLAHDGPIYSLEFSPFCPKIFFTSGADWSTRIWADGLSEPLITLTTSMACVHGAAWSPVNSTVIATIVNNEILIWDIRKRTHGPASSTESPNPHRFVNLCFTQSGRQLVAADVHGDVRVYSLEGMPFPGLDPTGQLVRAIQRNLDAKPALLKKLEKLGKPF